MMSKLSDIFGRRIIYIIDVALFAIGSFVIVISDSFTIVLLGRAIQGFGAGGIFPVASATIGDTFPKEKQGSALGLIGMVFGLAFLVGPIIGGLMLKFFSWHAIFILNIPVALLLIILAYQTFPQHKNKIKFEFDWLGALMLVTFLVVFDISITNINTYDIINSVTSWKVWPFLLSAVVLFPLFYFYQRRKKNPLIEVHLLDSYKLRLLYILALGAGMLEGSFMFMPVMLKETFQYTTSAASFALMPLVCGMIVGSPAAGRMIDRTGPGVVIIFGTSLAAIALIMFGFLPFIKPVFFTASVLFGIGLSSLLGAPLRYIMNNETKQDDRATGQGLLSIVTHSGMIVSTAMIGAMGASFAGIRGFQDGFRTLALICLGLIFVAFLLKKK